MSVAPILLTYEHVHNIRIQRRSCFTDNVSSRTEVMQRP